MSSAPRRSPGATDDLPQPVAVNAGSNSVSNNTAPATPEITAESQFSRSRVLCRFHATKKGCRAGDQCPYRHVNNPQAAHDPPTSAPSDLLEAVDPARPAPPVVREPPIRPRAQVSGQRPASAKPIPDAQKVNPREFQLRQVERRFSPRRRDEVDATVLDFQLVPSDPDFPFELKGLQCELRVPTTFPQDGRPSLRVRNPEIPRGYQINVERGFDTLINGGPPTLLGLLNALDRNLERFLTSEKAQTVKLVANPPKAERPATYEVTQSSIANPPSRPSAGSLPVPSGLTYTAQQKDEARAKRDADIIQLSARMSRNALFSRSDDGNSFNVPVQVPKSERLPVSLKPLKEVTLFVPRLYNLEPCRIKLRGIIGVDAEAVETAFERRSRTESGLTLMAHINYLIQNIHLMAAGTVTEPASGEPTPQQTTIPVQSSDPPTVTEGTHWGLIDDDKRAHVKFIPRPPEWDFPGDESDEESSEYSDSGDAYSGWNGEGEETKGGAALPDTATSVSAATGNSIVISFPNLELYGIELLELASLALTLKCDRCKSNVDIKNLKPSSMESKTSVSLTESCPKCATPLAASFHREPLHAHSIKAGNLDLTACTVTDMLPSIFTPTCSECSTAYATPPGVVSVRGEATLVVCRTCHRKMTFKIPEVKFLRVGSHASNMALPPRRQKQRENLGIVAGTPLPNFGKCTHYRKSQRWFRFSCCNIVYPCDKCHDEQADPKHPNEHANRMLCGFCSREQNYRPEDCGVCGGSLIGKRGGGFWEGGKGTRDKVKMNRKDPRKYKRRGGNAPVGG